MRMHPDRRTPRQVCITFNAVVQKRLVCAYPPIFVTALGTLWGGVFNFTYLAVPGREPRSQAKCPSSPQR